jgi:hypothetical protein
MEERDKTAGTVRWKWPLFYWQQLEQVSFVYLEDLIEEKYRGKGGGSLVMRLLAMLGQTLNCEKPVL